MGAGEIMKGMPAPDKKMLESPEFNAVWDAIKEWDINVPSAYEGYMGANGNHVRAILEGLQFAGIEVKAPTPARSTRIEEGIYAGEAVGWIDATEMR
jgi:hypothetical protein